VADGVGSLGAAQQWMATHEFDVLVLDLGLLAAAPGKAVARDALVVGLGQDPDSYDPRRMEILMRRLRVKALATLGQALPVATVHRQGYAFTALIQVVGGA